MGHRLLFLLLSLSLPSFFTFVAAFPLDEAWTVVDFYGCTNLQCEWKVEGDQCKVVSTLKKQPIRFRFDLLNGESEEDFLKRLKKRHPFNAFTIMNNVQTNEMCKRKGLSCTMLYGEYGYQLLLGEKDYAEFFERLQTPRIPSTMRSNFNC